MFNPTKYQEATHDEIVTYLEKHRLDYSRNWWHAREAVRKIKSSNPPAGFSDWDVFWKSLLIINHKFTGGAPVL
jgi:hypothetical protein